MFKGGANVTLKIKSIQETPIPVIPYQIQCDFEEKIKRCNNLEQEIMQSEENANMLMQAVLKEAFQN